MLNPFRRYKPGLVVLFFCEMWERFSFYLMMALLSMYMEEVLGFSTEKATRVYGTYLMAMYAAAIFLAPIADRWSAKARVAGKLGAYRKTVLLGAGGILCGHLALTRSGILALYVAMACIVIGSGFFKTSTITLLSNLHHPLSKLRDAAFFIFYMGINIGAFFAPWAAGLVRRLWGWHAAFGTAGVGMAIGMLIFWKFRGLLAEAEYAQPVPEPIVEGAGDATPALSSRASVRDRVAAVFLVSAVACFFWLAFHQNGSTLTFWARDNTVRAWLLSEKKGEGHLIREAAALSREDDQVATRVRVTPEVEALLLARFQRDKDVPVRLAFQEMQTVEKQTGIVLSQPANKSLDLASVKVCGDRLCMQDGWVTVVPALHAVPRTGDFLYMEDAFFEIPPELFASVNPLFIILFTFLVLATLGKLSTVNKIMLGMFLTATCYGVLAIAGRLGGDTGRVHLGWLVASYLIITVGELCLSPMGLALVSKLAPPAWVATMLAVWYGAISLGNELSGRIGKYWHVWDHSQFFLLLVTSSLLPLVALWLVRRRVQRACGEDLPTKTPKSPASAPLRLIPTSQSGA